MCLMQITIKWEIALVLLVQFLAQMNKLGEKSAMVNVKNTPVKMSSQQLGDLVSHLVLEY